MVIFLMKISNLEKEQKNLSRNTLEFHKIIVIFVYLHFTGFLTVRVSRTVQKV